jgi:gliding motility-associated-like protein
VTINVDTLFFPQIVDDSILCQNYPVQLGTQINSTTNYEWTPSVGLDNPNASGPIALPDVTTTYTLVATSANGYCSQTQSVTLTVVPADIDVTGDEYRELCLGESVPLTAIAAPTGTTPVQWSPSFYVSNTTGPNTVATPDESVTIIATYVVNGCLVRDSVRLRVDSLPDQSLRRQEDKTIYCPGDTVYLLSPTYEPANFPDIDIEWLPFGGQETPVDLWNMVITATVTHTFQRVVNNRACVDTSEIEVPVGIPPTLTIEATPETLCLGQTSQINVTVDPPDTKLEWQDMPPTLSCADCPNPVASPITTTTYSISTPDADCPSGLSVTIEVLPPPVLNLASNPVYCPGGPGIVLNSASQPGVTYTWTPAAGLDNPNSATPVATPAVTTTYKVLAVGPGNCPREDSVTVKVGIIPTLAVTATPLQLCPGETSQIQVTATPAGTALQWAGQPGSLSCSDCANPVASPTVTSTYTVTTPGADCPVENSITIDVLPAPALNVLPAQSICADGAGVQLNDISEPGVTYTWTPATGLDNPNSATPTASPNATTTYSVTAQGALCKTQATVTVTVSDATIDAGPDRTICLATSTTLTATVTGTQGTITWQPGNLSGASINVNPLTETTYTAQLAYGNGCFDSDEVTISVIPNVILSQIIGVPDPSDSVCVGLPLTLQVTVSPANAALVWSQDGALLDGIEGDSVTFVPQANEGSAVFSVTATSTGGCSATTSITYNFKRCVAIPNAFTPGNSDEVNDTFGPLLFGSNTEVREFQVFNRWGTRVFEATPDKQRWDGKHDGKDAPSDVYVYYIVLRFADGSEETLKGDITLLR